MEQQTIGDSKAANAGSVTQLETLIGGNTLGILHFPSDYEHPRKGFPALWRRHVLANAAVRDREYMLNLFGEHFPSGHVATVDDEVPSNEIESVKNVVLLFPDSIGLDFRGIERSIGREWPDKRLFALNGRRRFFRLDDSMQRRLALRRFLEKSRITEALLVFGFAVATPVLALFDLMWGRR